MIYEPENLKKKRAMYEKKDKWLIRLAFRHYRWRYCRYYYCLFLYHVLCFNA